MGRDKGSLIYTGGRDQRTRCRELLASHCVEVFVSLRPEQAELITADMLRILDPVADRGPSAGIVAAFAHRPGPWLVLACDFPFADEGTVARLIRARVQDSSSPDATVFVHPDGVIEPLFAIWELAALARLTARFAQGLDSPRAALEAGRLTRVPGDAGLTNVNQSSDIGQRIARAAR